MEQDIRWKQRFRNFENALSQLKQGIDYFEQNPIDLVKEGIIQRFEFTHELAWKVMKDFLEYEGFRGIIGSRSATREAFNKSLISQGQEWMNMIDSRNETVHTYNPEILETEFTKIVDIYVSLFTEFSTRMKSYL
ncbi:MAG: nucleotidyltransferase substrate binding protein [Spirosomataceae bacterium]